MGSKAINADAPIFLRASLAATTAVLVDLSSIIAKQGIGNTDIQIAVERAFIREKALGLIAMKELPS